jgi:hypothetical protein
MGVLADYHDSSSEQIPAATARLMGSRQMSQRKRDKRRETEREQLTN